MYLKIISPEKIIYEDEVDLVQIPGTMGPFTILHNHAPIISNTERGRIKIIDKNSVKLYKYVDRGFAEVVDNRITVLTDKEVASENFDKYGIYRGPARAAQTKKSVPC